MLNIEFNTTQGVSQVNTLAEALDALAGKADSAEKKISKALNSLGGIPSIKNLVSEYSSFNTELKALGSNLGTVLGAMEGITKKTIASVDAVRTSIKAKADLIAADKKAAESARKLTEETEKLKEEQNSAANAIAKFVANLEKGNASFGKTTTQILQMKAGFSGLDADLQKQYIHTAKVSEAMTRLGTSINPVLSVMDKFRQTVSDASLSLQELQVTEGRSGITQQQYGNAVKAAGDAVMKSIAALKVRKGATDEEINSIISARSALSEYLKAEEQFVLGNAKSAASLTPVLAALKAVEVAELTASAAARKYASDMASISGVIKPQISSIEQYAKTVATLNEMLKKFKPASLGQEQKGISPEEHARGMAAAIEAYTGYTAAIQKSKDAIGQQLEVLARQSSEFGKTPAQIMAAAIGWRAMNEAEQAAAQETLALNQALGAVSAELTQTVTPLERYLSKLNALTLIEREAVNGNSGLVVSYAQIAEARRKVTEEYKKSDPAILAAAAAQKADQEAVGGALTTLLNYHTGLVKTNAELGLSKSQTLKSAEGWKYLSTEQQQALLTEQRYAEAMSKVGPIMERLITPTERYRQAVLHLQEAQRQYKPATATTPQRGINTEQYNGGMALLHKDLKAAEAAQNSLSRSAINLTSNFGIATQATASFRAALMGANLGFGIFTSSTILVAGASYAMSKALAYSITTGMEFEATFERAAVVMEEFGSIADGSLGKLGKGAELVRSKVLDLAEVTQYGTVEVARAAEVLAQAGLKPLEIYNALAPSLNLAAIGMIDVAEAADIAVGVMYGFGATSSELEHIIDVMAKTVVMTNLNIKQVAKTMQYVAPVAKAMGLSLEETAAAIAVLGNSAIKGSQAGTSLRNILIRTVAQTPAAAKAFKELSINLEDFYTNGSLNLQKLFSILEKKGASVQQMKAIMGQWAITAALSLEDVANKADKGGRSWAGYVDELSNVNGAAAEMAAGMRMNLTGALENLSSVIQTMATKAFDNFGQGMESEVRRLTSYIKSNETAIVGAISSIMKALTTVSTFLVEWGKQILYVIGTFTVFKMAQAAITTVIGVLGILASVTEKAAIARTAEVTSTNALTVANGRLALSYAQLVIGKTAVARADAGLVSTVSATTTLANATRVASAETMLFGQAFAAARTGAVASTAATGLAARALTGFSGVLARGLGFLGGWGGVLLVLGTTLLPMFYAATNKGEERVRLFASALHDFNLIAGETETGLSNLSQLSLGNLKPLADNLKGSIAEHKQVISDLVTSYEGLDQAIARAYAGANTSTESGVRSLARYNELVERRSDLQAKMLIELGALKEEEYAVAVAQGHSLAAMAQSVIAHNSLNEARAKGLAGSNLYSYVTNKNAEDMLKATKVSKGLADALGRVVLVMEYMSKISPLPSSFADKLKQLQTIALALSRGLSDRTVKPEDNLGFDGAGADSAVEKAKAVTSALEEQIKAYEKATGSVAELGRTTQANLTLYAQVSSGAAGVSETLTKMGYSAEQAKEALQFNLNADLTKYFGEVLGQVDSRYSDLGKTVEKVKPHLLGSKEAVELLKEAIKKLPTESQAAATALLDKLNPALEATANGSLKLEKEFQKLRDESALFWAEISNPTDLGGQESRYAAVIKEQDKLVLSTLRFKKLFGDAFAKVGTESQQIKEAATVFAALRQEFIRNGKSAEQLQRVWKNFERSLPTGALEFANENLENQIALTLSGVDSLELYNAAWEATGGYLEDVSDQFLAAKKKNIELQETLKQIDEVKAVYKSFGEGLAKIFTDVFSGGIKSFKDFASRLKDLFAQMLTELMYMAIKNNIMGAMFNTQGNTAGMWQSIFGGGNTGGSQQVNLLSSLFGGNTQQQGGGFNLGSVLNMFGGSGSSGGTSFGGIFGNMFGGSATGSTASGGSSVPWFMNSGGNSVGNFSGTGAANFGAMLPYAGAALGAGFGYSNRGVSNGSAGSLAAGAAYGTAGYALGTVAMYAGAGAAGAAGLGAGAMASGAAGGAAMGAAAVPVIGWVIAAIAALDMLTGGKVFGTRYRAESSTSTIGTGGENGTATVSLREVRQGALFSGRQWRNRSIKPGDDMLDAARSLYDSVYDTLAQSARQLQSDVPPMIDAAVRTVTKYDSKGKVKSTKIFVDILGRTWEEATNELAAKRITGEAIIYSIDQALGYVVNSTAEAVTQTIAGSGGVGDTIREGVDSSFDTLVKAVNEGSGAASSAMGEASSIAERWRDDAETLLDGANFLLLAATDMRNGISLYADIGPGTLTRTADIIEELAYANEPLAEAYVRVRDSVKLVEQTLGAFGVETGRTRDEFITFSATLVETLGGIDVATTKLKAFAEAFGELSGLNDYTANQNRDARSTALTRIGLDPNTSATEFAAAFRERLPELTAQEVAQWINAGMTLVPIHNGLEQLRIAAEGAKDPITQVTDEVNASIESLRVMGASETELAQARIYGNQIIQRTIDEQRQQLEDFMAGIGEQFNELTHSDYENQINSIGQAMKENIAQAIALGATLSDLAQIESLAQAQIARVNQQRATQLADMMRNIEGQIAGLEGRSYTFQLSEINRQMEENVRTARDLGATTNQLSRIYRLAADQIAAVIAELRSSISSLVEQLYGSTAEEQVMQYSALANGAGVAEQQQIVETSDLELERYNAAQAAIKRIDEYLRGLMTSQLAPGGWRERLQAAQINFQDMFNRAMTGDPEAMAQLADAANTYLELAQQAYGPGIDYTQIFDQVTRMLREFQDYARTIQDPGTGSVGTDTGGGGGSSSSDTGSSTRLSSEERYRLALQIAQQIGQLGLAENRSVFDLMEEYHIDIGKLAEDFGIDISRFESSMGRNLGLLANSLGVSLIDLMREIGLSGEALASAFNISLTDFGSTNLVAIRTMANTMGISVFDAVQGLGINLNELAESFGVDIWDLGQNSLAGLTSLSEYLGISILDLSQALGMSLTDLANTFGISVDNLGQNVGPGLQAMATALGVTVGELVTQLGISLGELAVSFGINVGTLTTNTTSQLVAMSSLLGIGFTDLIGQLGIGLGALATSFGVDLNAMSASMFTRFAEFARTIGQDIFSLASSLGADLTTLGGQFVTAVQTNLETLPEVPDDIKDGLQPYLDAIKNADNSAEVKTAVQALHGYVNSLPAGVAASLNTMLATLGVTNPVAAVTTESYYSDSITAQNAIKSATEATANNVFNADINIVSAIGNSSLAIVSAINALAPTPEPPPPPEAATSALMDKLDKSASNATSQYYANVSEQQSEALAEASRISKENAESMKKVDEKLDEVVQVLDDKLTTGQALQQTANTHLIKIAKKTAQLNEKGQKK